MHLYSDSGPAAPQLLCCWHVPTPCGADLPMHRWRMTSPEMGEMFKSMTHDMGSKLSGYYYSLQERYGDPRVYAAQQQEMRQREAAAVHSQAKHTSELLREAYGKQTQKHREEHAKRMSKHQVDRTASSHQQSDASGPAQTAPPRKRPSPRPQPKRPSDS